MFSSIGVFVFYNNLIVEMYIYNYYYIHKYHSLRLRWKSYVFTAQWRMMNYDDHSHLQKKRNIFHFQLIVHLCKQFFYSMTFASHFIITHMFSSSISIDENFCQAEHNALLIPKYDIIFRLHSDSQLNSIIQYMRLLTRAAFYLFIPKATRINV